MNLSGIFDVLLRRNRTALKAAELFNQFTAYFQKRYGATLDFNEDTGICTVTRSDGEAIRFEPLSFVEIFDTATAYLDSKPK